MNVGFHHSAVNANLTPFFETFVLGPVKQNSIDLFPGLRAYHLDILSQSGMLERLKTQADFDKTGKRNRVGDMKGQVSVAVAENLLNQSRPVHLLGGHGVKHIDTNNYNNFS